MRLDQLQLQELILSISLPFEFRGPVPGKFMVGAVGDFTLQPMARTNHKFPGPAAGSFERKRNRQYFVIL